jgi:hypothetical protein
MYVQPHAYPGEPQFYVKTVRKVTTIIRRTYTVDNGGPSGYVPLSRVPFV